MIKQFLFKSYKRRLENELEGMDIKSLEEYTTATSSGCEQTDFYKKIIETTIGEIVTVTGYDVSDGSYEIAFLMANGREYTSISKDWYTKEYVVDTVMDVLIDYLQDVWDKRKSEIFRSKSMNPCFKII